MWTRVSVSFLQVSELHTLISSKAMYYNLVRTYDAWMKCMKCNPSRVTRRRTARRATHDGPRHRRIVAFVAFVRR